MVLVQRRQGVVVDPADPVRPFEGWSLISGWHWSLRLDHIPGPSNLRTCFHLLVGRSRARGPQKPMPVGASPGQFGVP
jgi:hypothetical protein